MKKLLFVVAMLAAIHALPQSFEGTVVWSMKMDITDPKKKAQMEEAQKRMNDPQFKAMMESNPQMKAQMGAASGSMMPTGMVMKIKGKNILSKMEGGMFANEILYLSDKNQSYSIDRQEKTYTPLPQHTPDQSSQANVVKTNETAKILGYSCTKYTVEVPSRNGPATQYIWATADIKDVDMKALSRQGMGRGQVYLEKVEGVPLKIEMKTPDGLMVMEATDLKRESLSADLFSIPSDYKEKQGFGQHGQH